MKIAELVEKIEILKSKEKELVKLQNKRTRMEEGFFTFIFGMNHQEINRLSNEIVGLTIEILDIENEII